MIDKIWRKSLYFLAWIAIFVVIFSGCVDKFGAKNSANFNNPAQNHKVKFTNANAEILGFYNEKTYSKIAKNLEISCKNSPLACEKLGSLYIANLLGAKINFASNLSKAKEYFARACDGKICAGMGFLYDSVSPFSMPKDDEKAIRFYESSCALNDALGCELLGLKIYFRANLNKDAKFANQAQIYLQKACKIDNTFCGGLGLFYEQNGEISSAKKAYERGCFGKNLAQNDNKFGLKFDPHACLMLGKIYLKNRDFTRAKSALKMSCNNQIYAGCELLDKIENMR